MEMAMRGSGPRARFPITIDVRAFGWDRAIVATLRHSTVGCETVDAVPLHSLRDPGKRDRLSLLGQFCAHEALLQFAGVADTAFDASEWAVVQKRGVDCRLVRTAARRATGDPVPILTIVEQFAHAVDAPPLDVLRQSSARAEAVYCDIDARLRSDATADLRWFRAAALGQIAAPGVDALRGLLIATTGRYRCDDPDLIATLRLAIDELIVIGDASSPLVRFSGIRGLLPDVERLSEGEVVERVIEAASRRRSLFVVASTESLDAASRKVVELLQGAGAGVWIGESGTELPESDWFVVSPRLTVREELHRRLADIPRDARRAKLQQFIDAPCFARYLADGVLPTPQLASASASIKEPQRSYLAAVALLGASAPVAVAQSFLERFS
ncbi:MAG TPA: hypothetical protein VLU46_14560, partial [Thermoanaerobaculia bacterium]|nr:hypothetical protein [Thermoanaerobaculia bacterium]